MDQPAFGYAYWSVILLRTCLILIDIFRMVIDHELLFVGTFNFDPRSANLNTEVGILMRNHELAAEVEKAIETDILPQNSWNAATDNPDHHAPFTKQLKSYLLGLLPMNALL